MTATLGRRDGRKIFIRFWEVAPDPCDIVSHLEVEANFCQDARNFFRVVNDRWGYQPSSTDMFVQPNVEPFDTYEWEWQMVVPLGIPF